MTPNINRISDDLFLITLTPALSGFNNFIGAWLYTGEPSFLVDVGPSSTANQLILALGELGIEHLDYILLTHIHLDHAGAIGELAGKFPESTIVCHAAGIPHLVDPAKLWEATKKILGDMALAYGPIRPVSPQRFIAAAEFKLSRISSILTPGHAVHHVCYIIDELMFIGEAGGNFVALPDGREYMRPATPPKFFAETYLASIEKMIASNPSRICFGHYGSRDKAGGLLEKHREQVFFWENTIRSVIEKSEKHDPVSASIQKLISEDPLMSSFHNLPPQVQEREKYFMRNSVKGFMGYINDGK